MALSVETYAEQINLISTGALITARYQLRGQLSTVENHNERQNLQNELTAVEAELKRRDRRSAIA